MLDKITKYLEKKGYITIVKNQEEKIKIENQEPNITHSTESHSMIDKNLKDLEYKSIYHANENLKFREQAILLKERAFELKKVKEELINHPVFKSIKSIEDLQIFMSYHVFAVWDFMSLIKRLQNDLTCTSIPWLPNKYEYAAHLINEIVLGEESDSIPNEKGYMSHFSLYIEAMKEVGANTNNINNFISKLQQGESLEVLLKEQPQFIENFVKYTIETAKNKNTYEVLGSFFYGREDIIPEMFSNILNQWNINEEKAPMFVYYLKRHIELDSGEHGPAAEKIISIVTEEKAENIINVLDCAIESVKKRIELWNGIYKELHCN